jgi:capsular exopolysaccharide synthesis family protein
VLVVLGLTVGIIFLRALTDQRVKSASDLAVLPGARILGVIPDLDDDPTKCPTAELVVSRYPNSVVGESYRQANTPILKRLDRAGHQTVVLMGGMPGAGTTTVASNMASGFAASGRRVLVVDANFRRPRLAEVFGVDKNRAGLGDVLADAVTVDEAIETTEFGVSVMAAGTPASRIVERFNMAQFDSVVAELRSRYDFVIFDSPPAVVAGEPMMLANKLDAAVLIVRANQEHRGLVARLIGQLSDTPCELIGLVLNRPRGTAGGYFKKNFATMAKYASSS